MKVTREAVVEPPSETPVTTPDVEFTDASLNATDLNPISATLTRAGRPYRVITNIQHSNTVDGVPTVKTITIQVNPLGSSLGSVTLRAVRTSNLLGPNR